MLSLVDRNVNHVFPVAMIHLTNGAVTREIAPRGQKTLEYLTPVCSTYLRPQERVLFIPGRGANPFFHFFEALWILAGREDVEFLAQFNPRMAEYSDNGQVFHAPYGRRLRRCGETHWDQLAEVIALLQADPDTRRAVLQIWDADLDLGTDSKDLPCNTTIYLKIREGRLHMTVCNRSNDALWGAYGANVVQFSTLQEYLATMIGVEVGLYHQISDSFHVYTDLPLWQKMKHVRPGSILDPYEMGTVRPYPLVTDAKTFDHECRWFVENPARGETQYTNTIFQHTAPTLYRAWIEHQASRRGLQQLTTLPVDLDWRAAAEVWLKEHGEVDA